MLSGTYVIDGDESPASARFGLLPWVGGTWPSVRHPGSSCIAAFWPDVMPIPTHGGHFTYHWNGNSVGYVKRLDTGAIMHVL